MVYDFKFKVLVSGNEVSPREGSIEIVKSFDSRTTGGFTLVTPVGTDYIFKRGEPVDFIDTSTEPDSVVYRGLIGKVKYKDFQGTRFHQIQVRSFSYLAEKRLIAKVYENMTIGQICRAIVDDVLTQEGVTYTADSIKEGLLLEQISFNYVTVAEALQKVTERYSLYWYIDHDKVLHVGFPELDTGSVDYSTIQVGTLDVEQSNKDYRNTQWVKGGRETTSLQTEIKFFDANNKAKDTDQPLTMGYRLQAEPVEIRLFDNGGVQIGTISQTNIFKKGYLPTGGDVVFVEYEKGSEVVIVKDLIFDTWASAEYCEIDYYGVFNIVAKVNSPSEVDRLKVVEASTSGIVENISTEPDLTSMKAVFDSANARLKKYANDNVRITFQTQTINFEVGQMVMVNFPDDDIVNEELLCEEITITDEYDFLWYNVTLVKGQSHQSWVDFFVYTLGRDNTSAREEMIEQEIVITNQSLNLNYDFYTNPNPMRKIFCGGTDVVTGATLKVRPELRVNFDWDDRVTHLEVWGTSIDNPVEHLLVRKPITSYTQVDKNLYCFFSVTSYEAIGDWSKIRLYGGATATWDEGTGVLLDDKAMPMTKTTLDNIVIDYTLTQNW